MTTKAEPAALRDVEQADGSHLTVRHMTEHDVDAVLALFEGLSQDDRRYRFFAFYRPPREFVERMALAEQEGRGAQLVAVHTRPPAPGRVVAEAGYVLLPNGDGELGITVDTDYRGWLGPFLLDALLRTAADRGVPNLEADVLVENSRMLALARHRGYATLPASDYALLRLVIGATQQTPVWPGNHERRRLLIEGSGGRWRATEAAEAAGFDVLACPGPHPARSWPCPALSGQACPLVAGADVIIAPAPHPGDDERAAVLAAHATVHPGVPVCIEVPSTGGTECTTPEGAVTVPRQSPEKEVVEIVRLLER